jgi:hypothetical protein
MKISVNLIENGTEIIANCPELDINCYANTKDEAVRRIKNVITFYMESARELGLDVQNLSELTIEGRTDTLRPDEKISPSLLIN